MQGVRCNDVEQRRWGLAGEDGQACDSVKVMMVVELKKLNVEEEREEMLVIACVRGEKRVQYLKIGVNSRLFHRITKKKHRHKRAL